MSKQQYVICDNEDPLVITITSCKGKYPVCLSEPGAESQKAAGAGAGAGADGGAGGGLDEESGTGKPKGAKTPDSADQKIDGDELVALVPLPVATATEPAEEPPPKVKFENLPTEDDDFIRQNANPGVLPKITPRYHGPGCSMEVGILEKHAFDCNFKKAPNVDRNPTDDRSGSYECIGRMSFKICGDPDSCGDRRVSLLASQSKSTIFDPNPSQVSNAQSTTRIKSTMIRLDEDEQPIEELPENTRNEQEPEPEPEPQRIEKTRQPSAIEVTAPTPRPAVRYEPSDTSSTPPTASAEEQRRGQGPTRGTFRVEHCIIQYPKKNDNFYQYPLRKTEIERELYPSKTSYISKREHHHEYSSMDNEMNQLYLRKILKMKRTYDSFSSYVLDSNIPFKTSNRPFYSHLRKNFSIYNDIYSDMRSVSSMRNATLKANCRTSFTNTESTECERPTQSTSTKSLAKRQSKIRKLIKRIHINKIFLKTLFSCAQGVN